MMKFAVPVLFLSLVLNLSQAKTNMSTQDRVYRKPSASLSQMPTKSVRVIAAKKAQRRLLVTNDLDDGDNGPPGADELDLQSPYRRPRIVSEPKYDFDDELSDHVTVRLAVARARAMAAYRQKWQKSTDFS